MKLLVILVLLFVFTCFIFSNAQNPTPVFDKLSIPLTPGAYLNTSDIPKELGTFSLKTGKIELLLTSKDLRLTYDGNVVWKPYTFARELVKPTLYFKLDGNLCVRESISSTSSLWCNNHFGLNAKYLNILPEGSYGRKWAIVTQDKNGKMVWGRFGPAISNRGILPLIPGNYIDRQNNLFLNPGLNCINNGKDYLCINSRPSDAISFYVPVFKNGELQLSREPEWKVSKQVGSGDSKVFFEDGEFNNFCVTGPNKVLLWCNGYVNPAQTYLVLPIASDYESDLIHGAWVTLDSDMKIVSGYVKYLVTGNDRASPFPSGGISNEYFSMTFNKNNSGQVTYFNKVENKVIKNLTSISVIGDNMSSFDSKGFYFFKNINDPNNQCNFMNQSPCRSYIQKFEKPLLYGPQARWNTGRLPSWFGTNKFIAEAIVIDDDAMIIASSKNFGKADYGY